MWIAGWLEKSILGSDFDNNEVLPVLGYQGVKIIMSSSSINLNLAKYAPPLTTDQDASIVRLSQLRFQTFNETDVREEFLVPLIGLLGYRRDSDYTVLREESFKLNPLFLTVGSHRIKLDYRFNVYKAGFWLLEAKGAQCSDPLHPPAITDDMIEQAHFYAHHREVDCPLFGVSNGWWTHLYDRDAEDPRTPILSIFYADLPKKFTELRALIGAAQLTFWVKRRLLARIEQAVSADIDLARVDEFVREMRAAAYRAQPKVLENFRRNAKIREETQSKEFSDFLESSQPFNAIDTVLMWPLNMGSMAVASDILSRKVAKFPGSNQFLFFHKLLVVEPRPVTIDYYYNALNLLGMLCHKGELPKVDMRENGKPETRIESIYVDFARLLLTHFESRPDLKVLWAMEGLLKRMVKRYLLSNQTTRNEIAAGVELQRYFQKEEEIAFLGPSPARTLVQVVESVSLAELGAFFSRHVRNDRGREFDVRSAVDEFQAKRLVFEPLEDATDATYRKLVKSLGQEWSELTWADHLNRTWDRLGCAVCEVVLSYRPLLAQMPEDCRLRIVELARLGNSYARKCAEQLDIMVEDDYPDAAVRLKALFTLDAS